MRVRGRQRDSNLELLRIIAMLLIVMHHFSAHGMWDGAGSHQRIVLDFFRAGGKVGVDVFVLITGYFLSQKGARSRAFINLWLSVFFWYVALIIVFRVAAPDVLFPELYGIALRPISSGVYWFATSYFGLLLISPLLNVLLSRGSHVRSLLCAGSFVVLSVVPTITGFAFLSENIPLFCFLYLMGGHLALDCRDDRDGLLPADPLALLRRRYPTTLLIVALMLLMGFSPSVLRLVKKVNWLGVDEFLFHQQYSVPVVICSLLLVDRFRALRIRSKAINTVASTTFGIYLIHEHPAVRIWLWPQLSPFLGYGAAGLLLRGLAASACVFLACSVMELPRVLLIHPAALSAAEKLLRRPAAFLDGVLAKLGPDA